jgi:uncharacterized protein involved in exopolysaccharide biosynthesis
MTSEYRNTARQHRWLLLVPILLAPVIALWVVLGTPNEYRSSASLWFDTAPPADSSVTHPDASLTPPAAQAQILLNELLQTKQFRARVGTRAGLTTYLETNSAAGWDPLALLRSLKGAGATDAQLKSALGPAHVSSSTDGPQILSLSVQQPAPAIAKGTLQALIEQFRQEESDLEVARAGAAVAYYRDQVAAAKLADDAVRKQITDYLHAHPGSTLVDPSLAILTQAEQTASAKLLDATNSLNVASIGQTGPSSDAGSMRVIDPPADPLGPVRGLRALVLAVFAGLFGGLVVAIAGLVGLVSLSRYRARAAYNDPGAELVRLLGSKRPDDVIADRT